MTDTNDGKRKTLIVRRDRNLVVPNERRLAFPLPTWKQAGRAAAVSVATVAVQVGVNLLRQWLESAEKRKAEPIAQPPAVIRPNKPRVTLRRQRVVRVWRNGELTEQLVEGEQWTLDDTP